MAIWTYWQSQAPTSVSYWTGLGLAPDVSLECEKTGGNGLTGGL